MAAKRVRKTGNETTPKTAFVSIIDISTTGNKKNILKGRSSTWIEMPTFARSQATAAPGITLIQKAMKIQTEANKLALAQLEADKDKDKTKRDAKVAQDEEGLLSQRDIEKGDAELRRARMIGEALLIGKVKEYVEDAQYGGFITFEIAMPEQVQVGTILAIRRKTGILGKLKVSDISADGGIANPLPGFGPIQPKVGDEIILPPQY